MKPPITQATITLFTTIPVSHRVVITTILTTTSRSQTTPLYSDPNNTPHQQIYARDTFSLACHQRPATRDDSRELVRFGCGEGDRPPDTLGKRGNHTQLFVNTTINRGKNPTLPSRVHIRAQAYKDIFPETPTLNVSFISGGVLWGEHFLTMLIPNSLEPSTLVGATIGFRTLGIIPLAVKDPFSIIQEVCQIPLSMLKIVTAKSQYNLKRRKRLAERCIQMMKRMLLIQTCNYNLQGRKKALSSASDHKIDDDDDNLDEFLEGMFP
ncbi:hypothetical protein JHK87_015893 [Glycine soja]|nr:hypothetical protein JHK87_015893 [Glycine soja]